MQSSAASHEVESLQTTIQPRLPGMAAIASGLICSTLGIIADHVLGNGRPRKAQALLARLFQVRNNIFSHELTDMVVVDGKPVGLLLIGPWRRMQRLRLPIAFRVARSAGPAALLRPVVRSASLAGAKQAEYDEYFVAHLAVAPVFQGHGLGTLLMAHAEATTRLCGWSKLAPIVATDNVGPISFYRRWGFKIVDTNDFPPLEERIGYPGFHRMRKSAI